MTGRGVEKDHVRGRMLFQAAAELGSAEALYGLGVIYWGGYGVERNEKRAIEYLGVAADKGIVAAAAELGMMHYFSERKDSGSALRRFVQAAEAGDVLAFTWPVSCTRGRDPVNGKPRSGSPSQRI